MVVLVVITGGAASGVTITAAVSYIGNVSLIAGNISFIVKPSKTFLDYLTLGHAAKARIIGTYVKNNIVEFIYTAQGVVLGEISKLAGEKSKDN